LGYHVTAVDSSEVGLAKTQKLAYEKGLTVATVHADLADYDLGKGQWNGIVSIFCHLSPLLRRQVHCNIPTALAAGGVLLLEAYTPKQLEFKTGGPPNSALMMQSSELATELNPLYLDLNQEVVRDIHEGSGHHGKGAVVQVIGVR
jgi:hypothetical protein